MSDNIAFGILLPCDVSRKPTMVPVADYMDVRKYVGGDIDVVSMHVDPEHFHSTPSDVRKFVLCAYVHDTGLIDGLELNARASIVFGRELAGDVLLVSGTNPTSGARDGDNYDVPSWFVTHLMNGTLDAVANQADEIARDVARAFDLAVEDGLFTQDEVDKVMTMMGVGPHALSPDAVRLVQNVMLACLTYMRGRDEGTLEKFDAEGFALADRGLTDDDIRRLLEGE